MTAALVHDKNGWRYRGTSGQPHVFSAKTEYETTAAVDTVVDRELLEATVSSQSMSFAGRYEPRVGQVRPFGSGLELGDAVSAADIDGVRAARRVVSWRVSESDLAFPFFDFELNASVDNEVASLQDWLGRVTPGALEGRADGVSPVRFGTLQSFRKLPVEAVVTINQTGYLLAELDPDDPEDEGRSDVIEIRVPQTIYRTSWTLSQPGDTDTIVELRINDVAFHWITIPAGQVSPAAMPAEDNGLYTNKAANTDDRLVLAITQAGDYARGLVCKVWATSQA